MSQLSNDYIYPGIEPGYLVAEKTVAGSACVLSIIGAFLVIFSFLYDHETSFRWKELYYKLCCGYKIKEGDGVDQVGNKYRLKSFNFILINLSVADIIVACSHLWGLCSNLEDTFSPQNLTESALAAGYNTSCITQAAFTILSTVSSFMWTDILAVFLAFNIVFAGCSNNFMTGFSRVHPHIQERLIIPEKVQAPHCCESPFFLYILFPFIGWGIPMAMVVVFAMRKLLGYTEDFDQDDYPGWCYFYFNPHAKTNEEALLVTALGYELWLWGSIVLVLFCTITYAITACIRRRKNNQFSTNCTECRYLSVAIAFTVLRAPSTVVNTFLLKNHQNYKTIAAAVLNIIASSTISLQGGVNGIIYLCCRDNMRQKCCGPARRHHGYEEIDAQVP